MTFFGGLFYALAAIILIATGLAVTRRNPVHAIVYLVISLFATALLFYLLGAALVAALEVIIYAGAIMVLFLFIVMMLRMELPPRQGSVVRRWALPIVLGIITAGVGAVLITYDPGLGLSLRTGMASPAVFGEYLFRVYWFPVEIASTLLFVGLVGAYALGRHLERSPDNPNKDNS